MDSVVFNIYTYLKTLCNEKKLQTFLFPTIYQL
jgi:hypothetical protein